MQISDTHLSRRKTFFNANFDAIAARIAASAPDLVINSGDLSLDGAAQPDDLAFAMEKHAALGAPLLAIPGNHDIGDNPTLARPEPQQPVTAARLDAYCAACGADRFSFDRAGWTFVGLNALLLNAQSEAEQAQFDWLSGVLDGAAGRPVAVFLHKPLFLHAPEEPEDPDHSYRFAPAPSRVRLFHKLQSADVRLVASGHLHQRRDHSRGRTRHIWAPSTAFVLGAETMQPLWGDKEVGYVDYVFRPDGFEVRHLRADGAETLDIADFPDSYPDFKKPAFSRA